MKIGVVDLDTSHPQNWIPIERELGHEVVGIWDGGAVHPAEYVRKFAEEHQVPRVYATLAEMVPDVDCAIIHGCDWDTHIDKARPFVEAGKAVLLDKPMAGNLRDLDQLRRWARQGARVSGGSSLRFCREAQEWHARPEAERGTAHTALSGCAVDDFNYGIHAYALLSGLLGPGIASVRHLGEGPQRRIQVKWRDGRMGFVIVGAVAGWIPFYATVVTDKGVSQFQVDSGNLYRSLLEAVLPYLAGATDAPPIPMDELIEPELCALAARRSWLEGDREVALAELSEADGGYDGPAFAAGYRRARYPEATSPGESQ
jgi:hypothetical protein